MKRQLLEAEFVQGPKSVHHFKILWLQLTPDELNPRSLWDLCC